jgi:hypothetical protein
MASLGENPRRKLRCPAWVHVFVAATVLIHAAHVCSQTIVEVEKAPDVVVVRGSLGTRAYAATDREEPILAALPAEERAIGSVLDDQTLYDLAAHKGRQVSWFGIVRGARVLEVGKFELDMEHKYFDGLTDTHILALSFNGAGDFVVRMQADAPPRLLELARVYGTVAEVQGGKAIVNATYMRVFPWKTFTFLAAYGRDNGNPLWRKLCKVPLERIYNPRPDDSYYIDRLGPRAAEPATRPEAAASAGSP